MKGHALAFALRLYLPLFLIGVTGAITGSINPPFTCIPDTWRYCEN